jgi:hypothetical protein
VREAHAERHDGTTGEVFFEPRRGRSPRSDPKARRSMPLGDYLHATIPAPVSAPAVETPVFVSSTSEAAAKAARLKGMRALYATLWACEQDRGFVRCADVSRLPSDAIADVNMALALSRAVSLTEEEFCRQLSLIVVRGSMRLDMLHCCRVPRPSCLLCVTSSQRGVCRILGRQGRVGTSCDGAALRMPPSRRSRGSRRHGEALKYSNASTHH